MHPLGIRRVGHPRKGFLAILYGATQRLQVPSGFMGEDHAESLVEGLMSFIGTTTSGHLSALAWLAGNIFFGLLLAPLVCL
jgi:hypothetical protein